MPTGIASSVDRLLTSMIMSLSNSLTIDTMKSSLNVQLTTDSKYLADSHQYNTKYHGDL
ncbi:hypothetical protein CU097_008959 [Rhizopus azygosporus]|uniref:Uncharacterized protein n=1 Tax=Rhizopus azygosporus TaxID=86630 RepID=A0A367KDX3_RHIAZ|nr:hypothetical protein CU097_008959 [Rhizopus azygosporus]